MAKTIAPIVRRGKDSSLGGKDGPGWDVLADGTDCSQEKSDAENHRALANAAWDAVEACHTSPETTVDDCKELRDEAVKASEESVKKDAALEKCKSRSKPKSNS